MGLHLHDSTKDRGYLRHVFTDQTVKSDGGSVVAHYDHAMKGWVVRIPGDESFPLLLHDAIRTEKA